MLNVSLFIILVDIFVKVNNFYYLFFSRSHRSPTPPVEFVEPYLVDEKDLQVYKLR